MTDYLDTAFGGMAVIEPYIAPAYKSETRIVTCGACGSTAAKHTDKQCAANQKSKSVH